MSNLTIDIRVVTQKAANESSVYSTTTNRRFSLPTFLSYRSAIFNAKKANSGGTAIEIQTRLILDNKIVRETPFQPVPSSAQNDPARLDLAGVIKLDKDLAPGSYIFQVIVRDGNSKKKFQIATQWIDFELT